ncbi:MAG: sulfurtransferase [Burkholderiales bacterium]|nr:MAG: sulfurtransferase [Burkholderiales bacterium]
MYTTLIDAADLRNLMTTGQPVKVYDCSFDLMDPGRGRALFEQGHIPGAMHADLDRDLSDHSGAGAVCGGRHPLPARERLAGWLGRTGLQPGMQAVVCEAQGAAFCARLWWMLKWCGHEAVAVLDGGTAAWVASQGALEAGPGPSLAPLAPPYPLSDPRVRMLTRTQVAQALGSPAQTLLDARIAPRFRGEVEPLDPVAGHIPGALNRPFGDNFEADGRFKPAGRLRLEFDALLGGRDPATVVHQCGSGVSAIPNLLAMELAGLGRSTLYPGSWSEWCRTPGAPCARSVLK